MVLLDYLLILIQGAVGGAIFAFSNQRGSGMLSLLLVLSGRRSILLRRLRLLCQVTHEINYLDLVASDSWPARCWSHIKNVTQF